MKENAQVLHVNIWGDNWQPIILSKSSCCTLFRDYWQTQVFFYTLLDISPITYLSLVTFIGISANNLEPNPSLFLIYFRFWFVQFFSVRCCKRFSLLFQFLSMPSVARECLNDLEVLGCNKFTQYHKIKLDIFQLSPVFDLYLYLEKGNFYKKSHFF